MRLREVLGDVRRVRRRQGVGIVLGCGRVGVCQCGIDVEMRGQVLDEGVAGEG